MCGTRPYLDRPRGATDPSTPPAYVWCPALLLMCGALLCLPRQPPLTCGTRPYLLCAVPGVLCFAYERCGALLRQGPGRFDSPRLPLMCFACSALLRQPPALLRQPPGCLRALPGVFCFAYLRHPPALLCLAWPYLTSTPPRGCFAWPYVLCPGCFASFCLRALLAYVLTCFLHILRAVTLVVYMRKR